VRALGYDGRWTVHPAQVPVVNGVFTPAQAAFDRALEVLAACDAAARAGAGAARLDDEVIDEVSRAMAAQLVARGHRCGLTATPPPPPP
jgi:citrate lyase subunit beta/citryl-CoA lyase